MQTETAKTGFYITCSTVAENPYAVYELRRKTADEDWLVCAFYGGAADMCSRMAFEHFVAAAEAEGV